MMELKKLIQYQKPNADMLAALSLPLAAGVWTFGWRVAVVAACCMLGCWAFEYAFTRKKGKPASMASLVSGLIIALILPPNIPVWMALVGCGVAMVFAKMAFGGFGKNIFNPAMVGRCFLYICFPIAMTGSWYEPLNRNALLPAGLTAWTAAEKTADTVTGATMATAVKKHNAALREARHGSSTGHAAGEPVGSGVQASWLQHALIGNTSGSMGETSAVAILIAFAFLLWRKTVFWQLAVAPLVGFVGMILIEKVAGTLALPLDLTLGLRLFGGGTFFALVFMATEPITAPMNKTARWIYGLLMGVFAGVIGSFSSFPAGWMFALLLANTFGPVIEIALAEWSAWRKGVAA